MKLAEKIQNLVSNTDDSNIHELVSSIDLYKMSRSTKIGEIQLRLEDLENTLNACHRGRLSIDNLLVWADNLEVVEWVEHQAGYEQEIASILSEIVEFKDFDLKMSAHELEQFYNRVDLLIQSEKT